MSEPAPEPPGESGETSGETCLAPLDFSGACLIAKAEQAQEPSETAPAPDPAALADLLVAHSFGDRAVLLPSAATVRRVILDAIRAQHRIAGRPKRRELLVCAGDAPLPPEFAGDAEVSRMPDEIGAVRAAIGPKTGGLFVAPVRLAAGIEMLPGSFLAELREAADEYGLALIFDETDAGLGRTGMAFAHEWTGVTPDLMLVGEGAGLPLAALVLTAKWARGLPGTLPVAPQDALAAAAGILETAFAPGFEGRFQALGWQLEDRLATLRYRRADLFSNLVGTGLMQGLVCTGPAEALAEQLEQRGARLRAMGEVLAFLPPLDVTAAEITEAADRLDVVVAGMAREPA
ncbi:aminotransferase class III-fold pyridoxal phosphate-dependent enzyme [Xanthobacter oligotrophicus]|uniref:aminotransferase class III-fold pyridoxal phosphate-dependent enzyme n=1 Tax=Xanthobacter oligotrophicus TaxID=2607286 RepID=UPI0011F33C16|nr:aminotransferase class III-fold pyridoxal phosphate-dependent enzyme [Xanthobacter oligotrophicus]MCG5233570.1 aminotransferase class III-fold pyridoxal phosphate-dependent enzyme [Xanthobacter oligotrophicus]